MGSIEIGHDPVGGQRGEPGVIVRVVAHQVSVRRDPSSHRWIRRGPSALDEEGRPDLSSGQRGEQPLGGIGRAMGAARVLGVEGEGHAEVAHRSPPSGPLADER